MRENLKARLKCGFSCNRKTEERCEDEVLLKSHKYIQFTSNFTEMCNNHSKSFFFSNLSHKLDTMVFQTISKTPMKRVKNKGKI